MSHDNIKYVVISSGEATSVIDFNQVLEDSSDTLRYSLDGLLTFIKYEGDMPPSVSGCTTRSEEYNHEGIHVVLTPTSGNQVWDLWEE